MDALAVVELLLNEPDDVLERDALASAAAAKDTHASASSDRQAHIVEYVPAVEGLGHVTKLNGWRIDGHAYAG